MFYGVGCLNFSIGGSLVENSVADPGGSQETVYINSCMASFEFSAEKQNSILSSTSTNGVVKPYTAGFTNERYFLTVTYEDINWSILQKLFEAFTDTENNFQFRKFFRFTVDSNPIDLISTNPNESGVGAELVIYSVKRRDFLVETTDYTVSTAGGVDTITLTASAITDLAGTEIRVSSVFEITTIDVLDDDNLGFNSSNTDLSFDGIITSIDQENINFFIEIPILYLVDPPSITFSGSGASQLRARYECIMPPCQKKPFKLYSFEEIGIIYSVVLADFPTELTANDSLIFSGIISSEPAQPDYSLIDFNIFFGFADIQNIPLTTAVDGSFAVVLTTSATLTHPDSSVLSLTENDTAQIISSTAINTFEVIPPFTLNSNPAIVRANATHTFSGQAPPTTALTLIISGVDTADGTFNLTSDEAGNWSYVFTVPTTVINGTATITLQTAGYTDEVITPTVEALKLSPVLTFNPDFRAELNIELLNNAAATPNALVKLTILDGTTIIDFLQVFANNEGDYTFNLFFDLVYAGTLLDFNFTSEVDGVPFGNVTLQDTLPAYNTITSISVDPGTYYTGTSGGDITGTFIMSEGFEGTIEIKDLLVAPNYSDTINVIGMGVAETWEYNIDITDPGIPIAASPNTWFFELTQAIHTSSNTSNGINHGLEIDTANTGVIYPGSTNLLEGYGEPGQTVSATIFGTPYNTIVLANRTWSFNFTTPGAQAPGLYSFPISCTTIPYTVNFNLEVQDSTFALTTPVTDLLTNDALSISGSGTPGSLVTLTFTSGITQGPFNILIASDSVGWGLTNFLTWEPSGTYTATLTIGAPATDPPILISGNHEGKIDITILPGKLQGDSGSAVAFMGPNDIDILFTATSTQTYIVSETVSMNSTGNGTFNTPNIPLLSEAPDSLTWDYTSTSTTQTGSVGQSLSVRVPITINIPLEEEPGVLFTNTTYAVSGNSPSNGVISLSGVGPYSSINLLTFVADTYTGDVTTITGSAGVGTLEITVATVFQPSLTQSWVVTLPIDVTLSGPLRDTIGTVDVITTSDPNVDFVLTISPTGFTPEVYDRTTNGLGSDTFTWDFTAYPRGTGVDFKVQAVPNYSKTINDSIDTLGFATGYLEDNLDLLGGAIEYYFATIKNQRIFVDLVNPSTLSVYLWKSVTSTPFSNQLVEQNSRNLRYASAQGFTSDGTIIPFSTYTNGFTITLIPQVLSTLAVQFVRTTTPANFFVEATGTATKTYRCTINGNLIIGPSLASTGEYSTWTIVYTRSDPGNSNNTTVSIYENENLINTFNYGAILTVPDDSLTTTSQRNNRLAIYNRPLNSDEINSLTDETRPGGIFQSYRPYGRFKKEYWAINTSVNIYPDDGAYGYMGRTFYAPSRSVNLTPLNSAPNLPINVDNTYWKFNGVNHYLQFDPTLLVQNDICNTDSNRLNERKWMVIRFDDVSTFPQTIFDINDTGFNSNNIVCTFVNSTTFRVQHGNSRQFDWTIPAVVTDQIYEIQWECSTSFIANAILYINGTQYLTTSTFTGIATANHFYIGTDRTLTNYFRGDLFFLVISPEDPGTMTAFGWDSYPASSASIPELRTRTIQYDAYNIESFRLFSTKPTGEGHFWRSILNVDPFNFDISPVISYNAAINVLRPLTLTPHNYSFGRDNLLSQDIVPLNVANQPNRWDTWAFEYTGTEHIQVAIDSDITDYDEFLFMGWRDHTVSSSYLLYIESTIANNTAAVYWTNNTLNVVKNNKLWTFTPTLETTFGGVDHMIDLYVKIDFGGDSCTIIYSGTETTNGSSTPIAALSTAQNMAWFGSDNSTANSLDGFLALVCINNNVDPPDISGGDTTIQRVAKLYNQFGYCRLAWKELGESYSLNIAQGLDPNEGYEPI